MRISDWSSDVCSSDLQISSFPGEKVTIGFPAEMAISGSRLIDGLVKTQMRADAARRQSDELRQNCFDLRLVYRAGAVRVDIERKRIGHPNSIADPEHAAQGQDGGKHIHGEIKTY